MLTQLAGSLTCIIAVGWVAALCTLFLLAGLQVVLDEGAIMEALTAQRRPPNTCR